MTIEKNHRPGCMASLKKNTHKGKNEVVEVVKKLRTGFVDQSFHDGCVAEELVRKILLHIERHRTGTESRHIAACEQSEMLRFFLPRLNF